MFEIMRTEMELRNDSEKSIKSYVFHNQKFLEFIKKKPVEITNADIKEYLLYLRMENYNVTTIRLAMSAIKFYYNDILKRHLMKDMKRPKLPKTIPKTLEKDEIKRMIYAIPNPKHKLLIAIIYSSGIRIGEAVKVKKEDIFEKEGKPYLYVRAGKGKKDRITILSDVFIKEYQTQKENIQDYLFPSTRGKHINIRTGEEIVKEAARLADIEKNAFPHKLRASFATHLLDDGVDILQISSLLGHSNVNTTRNCYIQVKTSHLKNIRSPLDN